MNVTKQQFFNHFMCSFPSHPDDPVQLPDEEETLEEAIAKAQAEEDRQADNFEDR